MRLVIVVFMVLSELRIAPAIATTTYVALIGMLAVAGALVPKAGGLSARSARPSPHAGRTSRRAREVRARTVAATHHSRERMTTPDLSCFAVQVSPGPLAVIEASGELDLAGAPVLESAVRDLERSAVHAAVLDLRQLVFIDAAGLEAVLGLYAACLKGAIALTIIPGPRSVQRLFELTRVERLLPFSHP